MASVTAPAPVVAPPTHSRLLVPVFGAWSFLGSLLIFWVELMVAKMLLPAFGGSASVWNTALVFFQLNLLAGYALAHLLSRLDSRRHKAIQAGLVLIPLLTLPVALPAFLESPSGAPIVAVLVALTLMVGAPFFALATASPTLQAWFSHSSHPRASDPYFLYALSNVGSVVGLLGYPVVVERLLTLRTQTTLWAVGYGLFAMATLAGTRMVGRWERTEPATTAEGRPSIRRRISWAGITFIPSLALMGVTRHLSTDVAAFPLLWTVPLALYLGSFAITFRDGGEAWTALGSRSLRLLVVPAALIAFVNTRALWFSVGVPLLLLLAVALAGHGRVYRDRPPTHWLTHFYLWVSIGGAAGGLFAALVAPVVFDFVAEYPLALVLAALVAGAPLRAKPLPLVGTVSVAAAAIAFGLLFPDLRSRILLFGVAGVVAAVWMGRRWLAVVVAAILAASMAAGTSNVVAADRTFFGVYRVHDAGDNRGLMSGTTSHGTQLFEDGEGLMDSLSYYHPDGPLGDVMTELMAGEASLDVGVIGLGIGSMVGYGRDADTYTFYEIDSLVEDIARDPTYFTLLDQSESDVQVVIGDGRLELERRRPSHDLLVVDAFTSDSIPVHLLTVEAVATYFESLSEDGRLLLHISNRHLRLEPVVGRIAAQLDATARVESYIPGPDVEWSAPSTWVLIEPAGASALDLPDEWVPASASAPLWTDDYSNVLSVIVWG